MGVALICDAGAVTNPGATITAVPAGAGSSFTVRNFDLASSARLVGLARGGATKGIVLVKSPNLSDNVQGIRYAVAAGIQDDLIGGPPYQSLIPQDTLTVEVTGGAAEFDGALLSTYYDNLPGANMRLHMPGDISAITKWVTTWEVAAAAPATEGNWNNTLITTTYDESKANTDYAVLGYVVDAPVLGISLIGSDTSNYNVGGPGVDEPFRTKSYFQDLSMKTGKPCIPVFNTANKGNLNIGVVDVAASTTVNVTLIVAILSQSVTP